MLPAQAALAPQYYEAARADAASVIIIAIAGVEPPLGRWGNCMVIGNVHKIERGDRYTVGMPIVVAVPCSYPDHNRPVGGTRYQDMESLLDSDYGRAYLNADGQLALSQYEQLTDAQVRAGE